MWEGLKMKLNNDVLIKVYGGAWDASLLNAAVRFIGSLIEIGRMIGSSIRRAISRNACIM